MFFGLNLFLKGLMFQSLFCWKMPCNDFYASIFTRFAGVSILVLLEDALQREAEIERMRMEWFQSLFCWKMPCNPTKSYGSLVSTIVSILVLLEDALQRRRQAPITNCHISFNPCFVGRCPATEFCQNRKRLEYMFQSLFCWRMPCNIVTSRWEQFIREFQSLFCWKMPCNFLDSIRHDPERKVSILVLLEDALQLCIAPGRALGTLVFQSLFCWKMPCNSG